LRRRRCGGSGSGSLVAAMADLRQHSGKCGGGTAADLLQHGGGGGNEWQQQRGIVGGSASVTWRQWAVWQRGGNVGSTVAVAVEQWQQRGGGGGSVAAAAVQWQHGSGSMAVVAVRRQCGNGGQHGSNVGSVAAAAPAARRRQPAWWLLQKFGSITASATAAERQELRCRRVPPQCQQRHQWGHQWRGC
jgi:hypothetical protein